jgi:ADP-ribose pyrophosphatase YjhB (NUDIX family)
MEETLKKTISAGGVVRTLINNKIHIVLIRDNNKHDWVLPKGHQEEGETIEQTALREAKEETGLGELKLARKLGVKERLSFKKDEQKTIHYFLFDYLGEKLDKLEPTTEEDGRTLEPKWWPIDDLPRLFWDEQGELIEGNLGEIGNSVDY